MTMHTQPRRGTMARGLHSPRITFDGVMFVGIVLIVFLLLISMASQAFVPQPVPSAMSLNESDAGKTVVLDSGEILSVRLSGNPTTGYQWLLDWTDVAIVKPLSEPEYKPDSALMGAGGTFTWRFIAATAGQVRLRLVYRRSWEQDTPPLRTFEVGIVVR